MTIGDGDPAIVDTNVLVYASESRAPLHAVARRALQDLHDAGVVLWISRQIIREYLSTLTRPQLWGNPLPIAILGAEVQRLERLFRVAEDGPEVTARLLALMRQIPVGGKQVHDANIVATMQAHGIRRLLTHNTADFARFAGLITVVPL